MDEGIRQATLAALEEVHRRIMTEADRFTDPTEKEFRFGMRNAAFEVRRFIQEVRHD